MAFTDSTMVSVYNRMDNGRCGYQIPEMNIIRQFTPGETKKISVDELRKLSWIPGGMSMLKSYLVIQDKEVAADILGEVEPEYYYTKEDIIYLLESGSIEQLEDCLNFAPKGVKEIVRDMAIKIELNDMKKRKLIEEKTGFNVDRAIRANEEVIVAEKDAGIQPKQTATPVRKATVPTKTETPATPARKAAPVTTPKTTE